MKDHVDHRVCAIAARHLVILETQIVARAKRMTISRRIRSRADRDVGVQTTSVPIGTISPR